MNFFQVVDNDLSDSVYDRGIATAGVDFEIVGGDSLEDRYAFEQMNKTLLERIYSVSRNLYGEHADGMHRAKISTRIYDSKDGPFRQRRATLTVSGTVYKCVPSV